MPRVTLSQSQIDFLAEACQVVVNEHARFLDDDVRLILAEALYAMNKPREAATIEPGPPKVVSLKRR